MKKKNKFLLGAIVGAGLGLLFAPKRGSETRKDLSLKLSELLEKAKEIDVKETKENFENKIKEIETELKSLDKEKVIKIAKEKSKVLLEKTEDLIKEAKKAGKPVLEDLSKKTKETIIKVNKEIINRLEEKK